MENEAKDFKIQNEDFRNEAASSASTIIPLVHEYIHVDKQTIETGKIQVNKRVIEEDYHTELALNKEEIMVEKKVINQYVDDAPPGVRTDGDTTIISVVREVIVKRLLLVEEIHITKRVTQQQAAVNEILRKEEVTINRTEGSTRQDAI